MFRFRLAMMIPITVMYLCWYLAFLFWYFYPLWLEKADFEAVTEIASIQILILSRCIDSVKNDVSITFRRYYLMPVYYFSSLEGNVSHFNCPSQWRGEINAASTRWKNAHRGTTAQRGRQKSFIALRSRPDSSTRQTFFPIFPIQRKRSCYAVKILAPTRHWGIVLLEWRGE